MARTPLQNFTKLLTAGVKGSSSPMFCLENLLHSQIQGQQDSHLQVLQLQCLLADGFIRLHDFVADALHRRIQGLCGQADTLQIKFESPHLGD